MSDVNHQRKHSALVQGQADHLYSQSRPRRTEDACYVEQKNGALVRRLVGYLCYDTELELELELELLAQLYQRPRPLENFFYPSMKLKCRTRVGSKVRRRHDATRPAL